jgi:uncharacterized protein YeaO (DUF488 family)
LRVGDVTLDFADAGLLGTRQITPHHYAFLVSGAEFDQIFARIHDAGLAFYANPHEPKRPGEINCDRGVKRAYGAPDPADGRRVLVDRLWPRGLRKEAAAVDEWLRDIAPSNDLRRWYGHVPARFAEFTDRYRAELAGGRHADALDRLRTLAQAGPLTILTATEMSSMSIRPYSPACSPMAPTRPLPMPASSPTETWPMSGPKTPTTTIDHH